jgi:hypothetical protein
MSNRVAATGKLSCRLRVKRYSSFAAGPDAKSALAPRTDLIPISNPAAHASRLSNRAEEYSHGSSECDLRAQANAVEQGKADRGKATAATQTRLLDPDKAPDRGPRSRSRHV